MATETRTEMKTQGSLFARLAALLLVAVVTVLAGSVDSALALKTHPFISSALLPDIGNVAGSPQGIAVNESTHHVYVVQPHTAQPGLARILKLDGEGNPDQIEPELTVPPGLAPYNVAIDNSGGAQAGYLYVTSYVTVVVQQFDPSGDATSVQIDLSDLPPNGTPQAGGLPNVVNNGEFSPVSVAVGAEGNVFVYERRNNVVDKFSPTGTFIAQFALEVENFEQLAVADSGSIYLGGLRGVIALDPSGGCINDCDPFITTRAGAITVTAGGQILLAESMVNSRLPSRLLEYDPSGALISESGDEQIQAPSGIAVDNGTGRIYVASEQSNGGSPVGSVDIFGPLLILPDATTTAATGVTADSATFHGIVDADGGPEATCSFQYVEDAKFKAGGFEGASTVPCSPPGPFVGEADSAVEAEVADLRGGTTYHYRLVATNSDGSSDGEDLTFSTLGPTVADALATNIAETGATLTGTVNPRGHATTFRFQFVSQKQFEESGYAGASEIPVGGEELGAGTEATQVAQQIGGLRPGTAYRFRMLAVSSAGNTVGPDVTFATYSVTPAALPDSRAYEQASPVRKNGASAQGETQAVQAAADGEGITFYANAGLPGIEGAQTFPSYLSTRSGGTGWTTQGLLPPAASGFYAKILGWGEDLRQTYVLSKAVGYPPVFSWRNNAERSVQEIAAGEGGSREQFNFAAASADGTAVLFENIGAVLAPGAVAGKANAYLWDRDSGEIHLAGVLNGGQAPPQGSFPGPYEWFRPVDIDPGIGGASRSYYTQRAHTLSTDGSRLYFTAAGSARLYLRENPTEAQSPLDGEGNCTEQALACTIEISAPEEGLAPDPNGPQPAAFVGASADGESAFFISSEELTEDSNTGSENQGRDLYRYQVSSGGLVDLTPDGPSENGAEVQGVLGMSDDGSHVYFAANGVLADGASPGTCRPGRDVGSCSIYLANDGAITFVARVSPGASEQTSDQANWWPTSQRPQAGLEESAGRVSADGRTLLFRSTQRLTSYDNRGFVELYRYRVGEGPPACVSCNPTGTLPTGSAAVQGLPVPFTGPRLEFAIATRNLSADGNRVFFDSPDRLVASDTNGVNDVYEWEAKGSGSCDSEEQNGGCLYLLSGGTSPRPSYFGDADLDGENVFFFTDQPLVGQDKDELVDVYDARINGGIASQNPPAPPPPCEGEACRTGAPPVPPVIQSPGTASFTGPPNPKRPHKKKPKKHHGKKQKKGHHKKGKRHGKAGNQARKGAVR